MIVVNRGHAAVNCVCGRTRLSMDGQVPSIHPFYRIPCGEGEGNHTREFTASSRTDKAHLQTWLAAKAMAYAMIDLFLNPNLVHEAKATHARNVAGSTAPSDAGAGAGASAGDVASGAAGRSKRARE